VGTRSADGATPLHPQKLALTLPTSRGRLVGILGLRNKSHGVCSSDVAPCGVTRWNLCPHLRDAQPAALASRLGSRSRSDHSGFPTVEFLLQQMFSLAAFRELVQPCWSLQPRVDLPEMQKRFEMNEESLWLLCPDLVLQIQGRNGLILLLRRRNAEDSCSFADFPFSEPISKARPCGTRSVSHYRSCTLRLVSLISALRASIFCPVRKLISSFSNSIDLFKSWMFDCHLTSGFNFIFNVQFFKKTPEIWMDTSTAAAACDCKKS
jgi:hypothetical protein